MVDSENVVKENTEDLRKATEPEAEVVHEPAVGEKTNAAFAFERDGNSKTPENVMKDLGGEESQTHLPFEDWKCRTSVSTGHSTTISPSTDRVNSGRDFQTNKGYIILRYV
ncbi:Hypothetical predicted protein [Prunus dulcis]|uniref:Uncharacterized protein n=1 Tax=Prunus dulcis TaxID=3755 RepID=A0A5E4FQW6_PRUDU|nr:hypothetical protein L3X38_025805 [Prunus dulcis]VVA29892.1 Hypothetical predicted protein [Prunus dulcis]